MSSMPWCETLVTFFLCCNLFILNKKLKIPQQTTPTALSPHGECLILLSCLYCNTRFFQFVTCNAYVNEEFDIKNKNNSFKIREIAIKLYVEGFKSNIYKSLPLCSPRIKLQNFFILQIDSASFFDIKQGKTTFRAYNDGENIVVTPIT